MAGGLEAAVARSTAELSGSSLPQRPAYQVVDLGAGFGAHSIALARCGHDVLAVDASSLAQQQAGPSGMVRVSASRPG
jgi:2-polyprenyl-3-methyl-5-hydroxy-6-metoxy-1,4-benzoquinol methylase